MRSHASGRRRASFAPRLEALEDRRLLACTLSVGADGTLSITGDDAANDIEVRDTGSTGPGNITVVCDGTATTRPEAISSVRITTLGGNDTVRYFLLGDRNGQSVRVRADLGTGNDSFAAVLIGSLVAGSLLDLTANGNTGNDSVDLTVNGNLQSGSSLHLSASGSTGNDRISTAVNGSLLLGSALRVDASGSTGNDLIQALVTGNVSGGSSLFLGGSGSTGNDVLNAILLGDVLDGSSLQVNYNAGSGNDSLTAHAAPGADVGFGAALGITLSGGDGSDGLSARYQGRSHGFVSVVADGDSGDDRVAGLVLLDAGSGGGGGGATFARARGDGGNDNLRLFVFRPATVPRGDVNARIEGGSGRDVCRRSGIVRVTGCEA